MTTQTPMDHAVQVGNQFIQRDLARKTEEDRAYSQAATDRLRAGGFDATLCPEPVLDPRYAGNPAVHYQQASALRGRFDRKYSSPLAIDPDLSVEVLVGPNRYPWKAPITTLYLRRRTRFSKAFGKFFDSRKPIRNIADVVIAV